MKTLSDQFEPGKTLLTWWNDLDDNRAARAALRRASNVTEVTLTPHYQKLYRRLGWEDSGRAYQRDRLAAAVGLLAHIEHDDDRRIALTMSLPIGDSDRPPVSSLRFTRLLEAPDVDALFTGLRRVLPLMGKQANVIALCNDIVHWGDVVRKQWAYDYLWPEN